MANSFFKNGDKAYSENLNDSILVGNAFDWTVDVALPDDTGDVFPNSSTVVKGKVADCSITPNSNLSIGSTISNSSGSSQVYRLTVYPNFNRFGGFKSISLTADSGVTFYIANKGGTSPIASNLDYDDLGNVPELKVLKEYDIVLTIPNGKSVSGLEFVFQSSSADVSGSISQSNVTGLSDAITALETADDNIYNYDVYASDYNVPFLPNDLTISCHCTDVNGDDVSGKSLTLKLNGTNYSTKTTGSNGIATWNILNFTESGLHNFSVNGVDCQILVSGWKILVDDGTYYIHAKGDTVQFAINSDISTSFPTTFTAFSGGAKVPEGYRPLYSVVVPCKSDYPLFVAIRPDGTVERKTTASSSQSAGVYCFAEWKI